MKRISGGQLSRKAKAALLSSHAGDPRTSCDAGFPGQAKAVDTAVESQPAATPEDLPDGSDVTAQTRESLTVTAVMNRCGNPRCGV